MVGVGAGKVGCIPLVIGAHGVKGGKVGANVYTYFTIYTTSK